MKWSKNDENAHVLGFFYYKKKPYLANCLIILIQGSSV